jgi:signal transduction histidine kinase
LRELSLHILDLIENALRAGARVIAVRIEEQPERDRLLLAVEDDGPGLAEPEERATDPFFTTKQGKKTGLGLSLFRFRVEQSGGRLQLHRSPLGGLAVQAELGLGHVDRSPLGDLASTLYGVVLANPQVEVRLCLRSGEREWSASSRELAEGLAGQGELAVARLMYTNIKEGLTALRIKE